MKSITKTDLRKVIKEVKANLECKICFNDMSGKIYQCVNGHVICDDCKSKCKSCPYCKETISNRNLVLERLLQNYTIACPYSGCGLKCKNSIMSNHKLSCAFKPINCPFCDTSVAGNEESVLAHLIEKHVNKCDILTPFTDRGRTCIRNFYQYQHSSREFYCQLSWKPTLIQGIADSSFILVTKSSVTNYLISIFRVNDPSRPQKNTNVNALLRCENGGFIFSTRVSKIPTLESIYTGKNQFVMQHLVISKESIGTVENDNTFFEVQVSFFVQS